MLTEEEALRILNHEKNYEDQLVTRLFDYFLGSLDGIGDLPDIEADEVRKTLSVIASDSQKHSHMFSMLMQAVIELGEDNY